ncbi:MAG: DUF2207 domain-containing protein [Pseudomonadota bacterium]
MPARAEEVIEKFVTEIQVEQSGDILVTETIAVFVEGNKIKRGIYRDLPKYREGAEGGRLKVKYDILSITRDGQPENYFKERHSYYTRYYFGRENYFLPTGSPYTYEINYRVPKQVFYFGDYDEIYWNMTGNDWDFPIEKAKAIIKPPAGLNIEDYVVYVGYADETGAENTQSGFNGKDLHVDVTRVLREREGLSVAAIFPKGFFDYPSRLEVLLQKFSGLIILLSGLGICGVYYNHVWQKYGKDPRSRGLAPFYDAPKGISPALAHFIMKMGSVSSKELLTITIVSLAAKGYLTIEQDKKKKFDIKKTDKILDTSLLSPEEEIAYNGLSDVTKVRPHTSKLISLVSKVSLSVRQQGEKGYYKLNTWKWALGLVPYIGTLMLLFWNGNVKAELLLVMTVLSFVALIFYTIVRALFRSIHDIKSLVLARWIVNVLALFYIVGGAVPTILVFLKDAEMSAGIIIYSFVSMLFFALMFHLMKAPTVKGQEIMDHLRGLRLYMEKVEQPILEKFDPPEMSHELFEKYLPYAVALDVEGKWSEAFAKHAETAMNEEPSASDISPSWYRSTSGFSTGKAFATGAMVGGLGAALSVASATRSSSSSGGSGFSSGSSGGGGGGGGGGGW